MNGKYKTGNVKQIFEKAINGIIEYDIQKRKLSDLNIFSEIVKFLEENNISTCREKSAEILSLSLNSLSTLISSNNSKSKSFSNALKSIIEHIKKKQLDELIIPIFELKRLSLQKRGNGYLLDPDAEGRDRLRSFLEGKHGIYIFYNSTGNVIYIGKAERMFLYNEILQQLNRKISIYKDINSENRSGVIAKKEIPQGEFTNFISAYEIKPKHYLPFIEALLIRSYANDNTNIKMENFPVSI